MRLTEGEWLDLTAVLLAEPLNTFPQERLAIHLAATFDAPGCAFGQADSEGVVSGGMYPLTEQFNGYRPLLDGWGRTNALTRHPVLLQYRATGQLTMLQAADVPERFASRRAHAAWRSFAEPAGVAEQLTMPLGRDTPSAQLRSFTVGRNRVFSAAEMALAQRIWRLLIGLDRQAAALPAVSPKVVEVAADLRVTPRELAVLRLLTEGFTAAAIGRRLAISNRTVHKHLEHAYAKLGVSDKLSAVRRAHQLGLLSEPAFEGHVPSMKPGERPALRLRHPNLGLHSATSHPHPQPHRTNGE